jgi:hypothetical protein
LAPQPGISHCRARAWPQSTATLRIYEGPSLSTPVAMSALLMGFLSGSLPGSLRVRFDTPTMRRGGSLVQSLCILVTREACMMVAMVTA